MERRLPQPAESLIFWQGHVIALEPTEKVAPTNTSVHSKDIF